ncbi:unannotated protein [freshwater metagenome]|uniref:Unannotated protein n=1 Tax=freshwater metagenome TaxID=449393 RepID=A0A6J7DD30_9ZZZZ|nr:hypothetical protein [Actinomycetota bacterium]
MHHDALKVRELWSAGRVSHGPFVQMNAPGEVEIFAHAGHTHVVIDLEHGAINLETAENMMRAAHATGIVPFARVLANQPELITQALNIGAAGILVPHVDSAEEARAAVSAMRFGPEGTRGVCPFVRSASYAADNGPAYYSGANSAVIAGVLLEGREAYDELDDFLAIDDLDLLLVAPYDLSQSLGVTGDVYHEKVVAMVRMVCDRAGEAGKNVGIFAEDAERAADWVVHGARFVCTDVDSQILLRAAREQVDGFARALAARTDRTTDEEKAC